MALGFKLGAKAKPKWKPFSFGTGYGQNMPSNKNVYWRSDLWSPKIEKGCYITSGGYYEYGATFYLYVSTDGVNYSIVASGNGASVGLRANLDAYVGRRIKVYLYAHGTSQSYGYTVWGDETTISKD